MTDDELNRALAERLEPLGSFEFDDSLGSPKGLWECRHKRDYEGEIHCQSYPRSFHAAPAAAVALAEASGHYILPAWQPEENTWHVQAWTAETASKPGLSGYNKSFPRAIRDAVAAALGIV